MDYDYEKLWKVVFTITIFVITFDHCYEIKMLS